MKNDLSAVMQSGAYYLWLDNLQVIAVNVKVRALWTNLKEEKKSTDQILYLDLATKRGMRVDHHQDGTWDVRPADPGDPRATVNVWVWLRPRKTSSKWRSHRHVDQLQVTSNRLWLQRQIWYWKIIPFINRNKIGTRQY